MSDQESEQDLIERFDLSDFIRVHKLPCFCEAAIVDTNGTGVEYDKEKLYLYRQFEIDCIFAKSYSNILQTYLLHHRPSYVPSEPDLSLTIDNQSSNIQYLFSDIVSIPIAYTGLFEIFSSNSVKSDGILDHEKDIASLMSRIRKPKLYYVAKEMKVYEMSPDKNSTDPNDMSRKWIKVAKGSIVKLIRVVSIDYEDTTNSMIAFFKKICCIKSASTKTDIAIELKILDNFNEIETIVDHDSEHVNLSNKFDPRHTHARLSLANIQLKSFFLPVYEKSGSNEEIDLIPISSIVKNQKIKLNSLQLAKNFASDNLKNDCIELKLFEENPFKPTKNSFQNNIKHDLIQDNQHLELEKYMSIYDLVDYRPKCKILAAYSFNKQTLVFIPVEQVDIGLKKKCIYSVLDKLNTKEIEFFNLALKDKFMKVAENELDIFCYNINKMETFAFKKKNFEGLEMNEIEKILIKQNRVINKFSDLENFNTPFKFDDGDGITIQNESSSPKFQSKTDKQKYKTLPHKLTSQLDKNEISEIDTEKIESEDQTGKLPDSPKFLSFQEKKTPRSYSLPVDKALIIKRYMSSKILDIN